MISDKDLADLCAASYNNASQWDHLWTQNLDNPVWVALKKVSSIAKDQWVVVFRGSISIEDWFLDAASATCHEHYLLGKVPWGFFDGLEQLYTEISDIIGDGAYICGHSLGAARAVLFAGLLTARGLPPASIIGFGCPNTGCEQLTRILHPLSGRLYRNREDPVPLVPYPLPLLPWQKPWDQIKINEPPVDSDPLADHRIFLYQQGAQDG